jgi:hypothetical protein
MRQKNFSFNERKDSRPVFKNREDWEKYRKDFRAATQPALKEYAKAHKESTKQ